MLRADGELGKSGRLTALGGDNDSIVEGETAT